MTSIPFLKLNHIHDQVRNEMFQAFEEVYEQNWFILGKHLEKFEREYASFNEVRHCVGVSNGLDALSLALLSLNIGRGDEVILPANSFIATALAVIHTGATPKFIDPDHDTFTITESAIAPAITSSTKAVIPVHLYGQSCNMPAIMVETNKHNIYVIEDNAQAQGATFEGKVTGSWGQINATSFYPGKNLGALGDAGAVTTNDPALAKIVMSLRNYGAEKKYHHQYIGYNMRMDECQAAFLSVKLRYLTGWIEQRRAIANWYNERLANVGDLILPVVHPLSSHVYHLYVVRTDKRDQLQEHLHGKGIGTLIHYPVSLHMEKTFSFLHYTKGSFPVAENIAATCLSLPLWVGMQESDVDMICTHISTFFK
jgi:dTDP-4-amino-4,6-dideoxygalactose transaminase